MTPALTGSEGAGAIDVRRVIDEDSLPEYAMSVRKNDDGQEIVDFLRRDQIAVTDPRFESSRNPRRRLVSGIHAKPLKLN